MFAYLSWRIVTVFHIGPLMIRPHAGLIGALMPHLPDRWSVKRRREELGLLTEWATARYPGAREPSPHEASRAIDLAREVLSAVEADMGTGGT